MRRQYARWSFFFLISLSLLPMDGVAESSVATCLEARLYWESLVEKLDPHADVSLIDRAAMSLYVRGRSFGVRSFRNEGRENGSMISAATIFHGVAAHRDEFIPKFQDRLKELSGGKAELISIPPEEAGIENPTSDSSYFRLIRQTREGVSKSFVKLTQEGFTVLPSAVAIANKSHMANAFKEPVKRSWLRGSKKQQVATAPFEELGLSPDKSQKFWNEILSVTRLGGTTVVDAIQYDRAAILLTQGKSYGVATLKKEGFSGASARSAFVYAQNSGDKFISKFQDRVYQLSLGKAQLSPISAKEAGFDIVGHGHFFKLVWHAGRVKQEGVVWLTSDGVSVYPMPGAGP